MDKVLAIIADEYNLYGCPYCGYRSRRGLMSCGGQHLVRCGDKGCNRDYVILANKNVEITIKIGSEKPTLVKHPFYGIPKHGAEDIKPGAGGEFFNSRGIGRDWTNGCFICGGHKDDLLHNISGFVKTKEAGERVVEMNHKDFD